MIDVTSIINDPDFVQSFQIQRITGSYDSHGNWVVDAPATLIPVNGIVLPVKLDELKYLPEGERHDDNIGVYSQTELMLGNMADKQSDVILYDGMEAGAHYKVAFLRYYPQCALWYAICSRFHNA